MSRRSFPALAAALAAAVVLATAAPVVAAATTDARAVKTPAPASPAARESPDAVPEVPLPSHSAKSAKSDASPAPSAPPESAPSAGSPAPAAAAQRFTYLRDRYRNDDQGAALQKPIKRLNDLSYMLGTWSAHIYTLTPGRKITRDFGHTTYLFARTMNNRWILGTDAKNTEFLYFTYDGAAKHWVYNDIKGFPSYGLSYAQGNPRHLEFVAVVESALGDERRLRTTLTYVDSKHFTLLDEEQTPDDAYTPVVEFDFARR